MRKKIYQRFLITFIFSVGILLGFIMVFNFFVDPGNEFFHGAVIERKMAQALLQNKSVIVQSNYNERLLQKMMWQRVYREEYQEISKLINKNKKIKSLALVI